MYCVVITQALIYTASGLCLHKNQGASTLILKRGALFVLWTLLLITFMIHMGQVPQDGNFAQNVALFC